MKWLPRSKTQVRSKIAERPSEKIVANGTSLNAPRSEDSVGEKPFGILHYFDYLASEIVCPYIGEGKVGIWADPKGRTLVDVQPFQPIIQQSLHAVLHGAR